jgi:hypothetical protein
MIRLSFKITWPLLFLLLFAALVWLLHRAGAAQAQPAAQPINRARIINMPPGDGHEHAGESTFDRYERAAADAGRAAYTQPNEFSATADRLRRKHYAERARKA